MQSIAHNKLVRIHIIRRELGLTDEQYRSMLKRIAGVTFAKELDDRSYDKVTRHFERCRQEVLAIRRLTTHQRFFIEGLQKKLGWNDTRCRNFLLKYCHVAEPSALDRKQATKLIESLKNVLQHRHPN